MGALGKLVGAVLGAVLTLLIVSAGPLVYLWDREPTRPTWTQAHFWFLHFPDWIRDPSLAVQANAQTNSCRIDFATEQRSFRIVDGALSLQNARTRAISVAGLHALASSAPAVARYASASAHVSQQRATNDAPIVGDDECLRVKSADQHFLEALAR